MKRAIGVAVAFGILAFQPNEGRASKTQEQAKVDLPNPVLRLTAVEPYKANGFNWVRHRYDILNKNVYPDAMFASAPDLPPCGLNRKSSRSWVDFYDSDGGRLYGFCALGATKDLGSIWFATKAGTKPPARVYIEINDRQTSMKYKSNLARTLPPIKAQTKLRRP